jgi:uncharacterized membrane protein
MLSREVSSLRPTQAQDEALERRLGRVLRGGVLLAASVVALGGAVYLARHGGETADYRLFRGEPSDLRSVTGILTEVRAGSGRGIVQLGLLLLIATPLARVVFAALAFARERDALYAMVALVVLSAMLVGLLGGVA